jgi:hypothetical protein
MSMLMLKKGQKLVRQNLKQYVKSALAGVTPVTRGWGYELARVATFPKKASYDQLEPFKQF